ncbi:MAG: ROK family protein [Acidobacteria bacterium]|nr:MAG: ROK family protein [Acidobacteriota bacterium]
MRGGIDLGGTKIQAIVVSGDSGVAGEARHPTPRDDGPGGVAAAMAAALREAAAQAGVEPGELVGVGVGSPGDVDSVAGTVANAGNLPDWQGSFPLAATLSRDLGTRVAVGNDVSVATNAEYALGAGRGHDSVLGVFWGTGVGGGLILGGEPWHGRGAAGEIGHMVVKRDGAKCPCGNHGCVEAYAGRSAMEAEARRRLEDGHHTDLFKLMVRHGKPRLTSGIWERALDHGDKMTADLLDRAVKALGAGIASAVNLIDPEVVILGGGLGVRFGERLGPAIRERMERNLFNHDAPPAFRIASLGDLGGALGAALLVTER